MPRLKDLNVLNLPTVGRHLTSVRLVQLALLICATALLGACANTNPDETVAWSETKLFTEAKDKMSEGDFDKCGQYFEKLEARFPLAPTRNKHKLTRPTVFGKHKNQHKPWYKLIALLSYIKATQISITPITLRA